MVRIEPLAIVLFFASIAVGVYYINMTAPSRHAVYVFPTPDNVDELQFTDLSKTCFKYEAHRVQCPVDKSKVSNYKVQGA
jgi:hypothetical protein